MSKQKEPQIAVKSGVARRRKSIANSDETFPETSGDYLNFEGAMKFLGTSKPTLYRLLSQGSVKGLKVGRQWRFRREDLIAHMERKPETVPNSALHNLETERKFLTELTGYAKYDEREESYEGERAVVDIINRIIWYAIEQKASDIHLQGIRQGALLRFRIDGVLHVVREMPSGLLPILLNRLKVMADMSLEERNLPQEGRIHIYLKPRDENYDLQVSNSPAAYGDSMTMRIHKANTFLSLDKLGLTSQRQARLQHWLHAPMGLIVVAGASGSGRTTTLYAMLSSKVSPAIKALTIEDPVQYNLPYATQVHVNHKAGLTYAAALRAFTHQDADIIMADATPDKETADLLIQATLSGQLVLTTLPALSAPLAALYLAELGIEPFLLASALRGVTAQRLARRICPDCKESSKPDSTVLKRARELAAKESFAWPSRSTFYAGKGCTQCRQTGYRGRVGIYEVMDMSDAVKNALIEKVSLAQLTQIAVGEGMETLFADGMHKVLTGETTLEELMRVLAF
jgi:excisionase family DNA binding protein